MLFIPFTYLVRHIPTNRVYYGVRYSSRSNPNDLWTTYYTSSKQVHKLIDEYGVDSFEFEIRRTFSDSEKAKKWENTVLRRINARGHHQFINVSNNSPRRMSYGPMSNNAKHKLSTSRKETIRILCEVCGKSCQPSNYKRWHGPNCGKPRQTHWTKGHHHYRLLCVHCGNNVSDSNYKRSHGDRCKALTNNTPFSAETILKIKEKARNRVRIECPYCGILVTPANYSRWHGDNCKIRTP